MKTPQTETRTAGKWGKAVGYGIAIGTFLGTAVAAATQHTAFIYIGMLSGAAIGLIFKSKRAKSAA